MGQAHALPAPSARAGAGGAQAHRRRDGRRAGDGRQHRRRAGDAEADPAGDQEPRVPVEAGEPLPAGRRAAQPARHSHPGHRLQQGDGEALPGQAAGAPPFRGAPPHHRQPGLRTRRHGRGDWLLREAGDPPAAAGPVGRGRETAAQEVSGLLQDLPALPVGPEAGVPEPGSLLGGDRGGRPGGKARPKPTRHPLFTHSNRALCSSLQVAPDFFEYFRATLPLLRSDPSLWCVSAWNDNGRDGYVDPAKPDLLYRTDFFPGLGWMLLKEHWEELEPKWPASFWDDWMREPEQRRNRACIRPEISRTLTFGRQGVSLGQFYDKYLRYIKLNAEFVPFTKLDLSYLKEETYRKEFEQEVYAAPVVTYEEVTKGQLKGPGPFRLQYSSRDSFKLLSKNLGIMDDFKSGVPRTGYRGVVAFTSKGRRIFLAPPPGWSQYDTTWS